MTREEILEMSRTENAVMDEYEERVNAKGGDIAGRASIALGMILCMLNVILDGPEVVTCVIWAVLACHNAIYYGFRAYHLKKPSNWFGMAWIAACGLFFLLRYVYITFGLG